MYCLKLFKVFLNLLKPLPILYNTVLNFTLHLYNTYSLKLRICKYKLFKYFAYKWINPGPDFINIYKKQI